MFVDRRLQPPVKKFKGSALPDDPVEEYTTNFGDEADVDAMANDLEAALEPAGGWPAASNSHGVGGDVTPGHESADDPGDAVSEAGSVVEEGSGDGNEGRLVDGPSSMKAALNYQRQMFMETVMMSEGHGDQIRRNLAHGVDLHTRFSGMGSVECCLLYTSPSPRDRQKSRMPSSA